MEDLRRTRLREERGSYGIHGAYISLRGTHGRSLSHHEKSIQSDDGSYQEITAWRAHSGAPEIGRDGGTGESSDPLGNLVVRLG